MTSLDAGNALTIKDIKRFEAAMTDIRPAHIRPGRYTTAICQNQEGEREQTPWTRDRRLLASFSKTRICRGFKVLYLVHAIVPRRGAE